MFFVAKEKIGTTLGAQKEYTACTRRGIGFTADVGAGGVGVWHYFWPSEMIEPSVRARFEPQRAQSQSDAEDAEFGGGAQNGEPTHYLWSQAVGHGELIGDPVINPYSGEGDWVAEARVKFQAATAETRQ